MDFFVIDTFIYFAYIWINGSSIEISEYNSLNADAIGKLITESISDIIEAITISIPLNFITVKIIKDYSKIEPLLNNINEEKINDLNKSGDD